MEVIGSKMGSKKTICSVDIMDIKQKLESGRFAAKINMFNSVVLEDTQTCEAIRIMQLPEGYCFRPKARWEPVFVYTSRSIDHPMEGYNGWVCSECGWTTDERHDYCVCGADMRESNKAKEVSKRFKELVDSL